jgi:hypothetical protein
VVQALTVAACSVLDKWSKFFAIHPYFYYYSGGAALADAMKHNRFIRELCIVDNKVGSETMTMLAGRLRGTASQTAHCMRSQELEVPGIHAEKIKREAKHKD